VGEITVRATPLSANVFLDGQRDGLTPRNIRKVPLGTHTIRVTRPAYATQEREVVLTAREPSAVVEFTLRPGEASPADAAPGGPAARTTPTARPPVPPKAAGATRSAPKPVVVAPSLSIETRPPGARVRVDGRDVGVTPLTVTPLAVGSHSVELQLRGYRQWSSTVTLAAGQRRRLAASLERDPIR
jgi:serine/threonine-protein kinase